MLCVLSRRQSKDKTALKRSAQRPRASRRGGARICSPRFFLSLPLPFPFLFLLFFFFFFFLFSRVHALSRAYVSRRFACRVRGRGSRRTDREKKKTGSREGGGRRRRRRRRKADDSCSLAPRPTSPAPTFRHRLHNF